MGIMDYTNILIFLVVVLLLYLYTNGTTSITKVPIEKFSCPSRLISKNGRFLLIKGNSILKEFQTMEQYLNYYRFMNTNYAQKGESCGVLNSENLPNTASFSQNAYNSKWVDGKASQQYYNLNRNPGTHKLEGFEDGSGEGIEIISEEDADGITSNGCYSHDMCANSQFCSKDRLCVDNLFCYDNMSMDGKCPPVKPYFKFIKSIVKKYFLDDSCSRIDEGHLSYAIDEHMKHFFEKNAKIFITVMNMVKEKKKEPTA